MHHHEAHEGHKGLSQQSSNFVSFVVVNQISVISYGMFFGPSILRTVLFSML